VQTSLKFSIAALALTAGLSACRDASANSAAQQDELKRDLEMAASATINLAAPRVDPALLTLEGQNQSAPQASHVVRRGSGNRAVRSPSPTVLAEPAVEVATLDETDVSERLAEAPAPESSEPVAIAPRPVPVVVPAGTGDYGTGGGIFGGGSGVVIRGGGVDGDNCELHRRGRGGTIYLPPNTGGSVVIPRSSGTTISMGGMGGGRMRPGGTMRTPTVRGSSRSSGIQSVSRPSIGRRGR
jgi:hypothetical protein